MTIGEARQGIGLYGSRGEGGTIVFSLGCRGGGFGNPEWRETAENKDGWFCIRRYGLEDCEAEQEKKRGEGTMIVKLKS